MFKIALNKLFKSSTLIIVYQLLAMPLVFAADGANKKENAWQTTADIVGYAATAVKAHSQGKMEASQQQNSSQAYYETQFNNTIRLQPNTSVHGIFSQSYCSQRTAYSNGATVQITSPQACAAIGKDWIPGCLVLPARGNQLGDGMMCRKRPDGELMGGYAAALKKVAADNLNDLENYTTKSNAKIPAQGVSCYDKKLKDFATDFKKRERKLQERSDYLEKLLQDFMIASKEDRDAIKKQDAILNGGPGADEFLKDEKFEENFLGKKDPSNICGSILGANRFAKEGKAGGLRGIENMLLEKTEEKGGPGSYSAEQITTNYKTLQDDIKILAKDISKNAQRNNKSNVSLDSTARTTLLGKGNKALTSAISRHNTKLVKKFKDLSDASSGTGKSLTDAMTTLKGDGSSQLKSIEKGILTDSFSIDNAIEKLVDHRNETRKKCLMKAINGFSGGLQGFASSFIDPLVSSKKANDTKGKSSLHGDLIATFSSVENIDDFAKEIMGYESSGKNRTLIAPKNTFKSMTIGQGANKTKMDATLRQKPSAIIIPLVKNCNIEFQASGQEHAVKKLKAYAKQREAIKQTANINLESEIINDLNSCSYDTNTGVGKLSCSDALNTNSENFCVRTAVKCASNIKGCFARAESLIADTVKEQKKAITKFNASTENFKNQLNKEITKLNAYLAAEGKMIDESINLGGVYQQPKVTLDLSKEIYMGKKSGMDPTLKVVDPKAFLLAAQKDIKSLITATKKQRIHYVGSSGAGGEFGKEVTKYRTSYEKEKSTWTNLITDCDGALGAANKRFGEGQKATADANKKTAEACGLLQAFNINPESSEVETLADSLGEAVQVAAATPMGNAFSASDKAQIAQIRAFDASCAEESDSGAWSVGGSAGQTSSSEICASEAKDLFGERGKNACIRYDKLKKSRCSDKDFEKKVGGKKFCETKEDGIYKLDGSKDCKEDGKEISKKTALKNAEALISSGLVSCYPDSFPPEELEQAEKDIANMVAGYNCSQKRKKSGEVHVSVCNANADGTQAGTDKASIQRLISTAAKAAGGAVGVSSN